MMNGLDPAVPGIVALALLAGGILKGATGAGVPVLAVPVIAAFFDARLAVTLMATPNLLTNLRQARSYRHHLPAGRFAWTLGAAGAAGTIAGTVLLVALPVAALQLGMAAIVIAYVVLRLASPALRLGERAASRIAAPVGVAAGILQGATGISAPISLGFLNALRLERRTFIVTVSIFFASISAVQIVALAVAGLMSGWIFVAGILALAPLLAGMALGERLARRMDARTFDRVILVFLSLLALRLVWTSLG